MEGGIATFLAALAAMATALIALYQAKAARDSSVVAVYQNFVNIQTATQQFFFQQPKLYDMFKPETAMEKLEDDRLSSDQHVRQRHVVAVQILDYYESILMNIEVLKRPARAYWYRYVVKNLHDSDYLRGALLRDANQPSDDLKAWGDRLHQAAKDAEQRRRQPAGQGAP